MRHQRGFTLIELLVVVAVIAILAAIAVPNFLEAQTRSKVSRIKADMRTVSIGLESYAADYNGYPDFALFQLTRPVQYLTDLPKDIFRANGGGPGFLSSFSYGAMPIDNPSRFALSSVGPDKDIDTYANTGSGFAADGLALRFYPGYSPELFSEAGAVVNASIIQYVQYDPTNGAISSGDLFRLSDFQS